MGCADTVEGMGVRGSMARNAPRGSGVCLGSEVLLLRDAWGVGPTALPYTSSCCCRYWEYPCVLQVATAFAPTLLGKDQTTEGDTHSEEGLKPKLSVRGSATKEEKHKSFYAAAQAVN